MNEAAHKHACKTADILIDNRLRPADPNWVEAIAASIEAKGLEQPIALRRQNGAMRLVDGMHRLAALKALGVETLREGEHYILRDLNDDEARLAEIDTALMRHELTALDRALFLAERKAVHERMHPETANGGDKRSAKIRKLHDETRSQSLRTGILPKRFTADTADKIGLSERTLQLSIELAKKLSPEAIGHLRGTWMADNQKALLYLADEKPADQVSIARHIATSPDKNFHNARVACGLARAAVDEPQVRYQALLFSTWAKANKRVRAAFLEHIGAEKIK